MDLSLAGMISGAGEGAGRALTMGQAQYGAERLQAARDEMDNLRQQRLIEHQSAEARLSREAAAANTDKTIAAQAVNTDKTLLSHEKVAGEERTSREGISKASLENAKEMNAATNATHLLTAKLTRQMQEKQFDKTFTQAKLSALKDTVRELGNEITRLSVVVSNPLADKTDPSYKAAVMQLESATRLHNLYAKEVGLQIGVDDTTIDKTMTKPALPPFKMPGSVTPPARTPGLIQTPAPSAQEQESMRKSLMP
jgi:hypothetical protein